MIKQQAHTIESIIGINVLSIQYTTRTKEHLPTLSTKKTTESVYFRMDVY